LKPICYAKFDTFHHDLRRHAANVILDNMNSYMSTSGKFRLMGIRPQDGMRGATRRPANTAAQRLML